MLVQDVENRIYLLPSSQQTEQSHRQDQTKLQNTEQYSIHIGMHFAYTYLWYSTANLYVVASVPCMGQWQGCQRKTGQGVRSFAKPIFNLADNYTYS